MSKSIASKKSLTLFFDWSSPPSRAVIMYLKHAGIPNVKYQETRITKHQHNTPDFAAINPN